MFGKNPIDKYDRDGDGQTLTVVEGSPFYTIQGEGPFAGHPAVFFRLHGCHLACTFCDTYFSDPSDPVMTVDQAFKAINDLALKHHCKLVVLTGGEPLRQNTDSLVLRLLKEGYKVQFETAGSFMRPSANLPGVTVVISPKTAFVHPELDIVAAAYKYVISTGMTFTSHGIPIVDTQGHGRARALAAPSLKQTPIYYSPMDQYDTAKNAANMALVRDMALRYGRIGLPQIHKVFDCDEPM